MDRMNPRLSHPVSASEQTCPQELQHEPLVATAALALKSCGKDAIAQPHLMQARAADVSCEILALGASAAGSAWARAAVGVCCTLGAALHSGSSVLSNSATSGAVYRVGMR